ncbi:MAG: amidohydrolase [Acidobacteria bacterium]|nr:amidohydrolase [Acidobacteriota bacterium]
MRYSPIYFILLAALTLSARGAAAQQSPLVPDEIFYNGKVVTVDSSDRVHEAFAIRSDRFFAVGSTTEIRKLAGAQTRQTDLRGRTVIPGLMDNHNHSYIGGMIEQRGVSMKGIQSLGEMFSRIRAAIATARTGEPIIATIGWTEEGLAEHRAPTRAELDQVAPDRPLVVMRARGDAFLNSAALRAAGITRETKMIAGVEVPMDQNGEPTGQIGPPGMVNAVLPRIIPSPARELQQRVLETMQARNLSMGITSMREVEMTPEAMRAYQDARRAGRLKMRISMGIDVTVADWNRMDEILSPWGVGPGFGDEWLRLDSVSELAVDAGGATAWTREPHLQPPDGGSGAMRITPEQVREAMLAVNQNGWRPAIHISGDRALDAVLDAYEAANAERSIIGRRWVVEHIPMVNPDQMDRMARLGVVVSAQIQPYRGYEGNVRTYGQTRADRVVPMREMLDKKLVVSTGSDFPGQSNEANPFLNIYFYVSRRSERGALAGMRQKISRAEALRVSTVNNAYMTFEEDLKGSIEAGKLADFVILSADIMTVPEEEILKIRPLATYVGGQKMYAAAQGGF